MTDAAMKHILRQIPTNDRLRLMQCVFCKREPFKCGRNEQDEDENGMCKDYNGKVIIEPYKAEGSK